MITNIKQKVYENHFFLQLFLFITLAIIFAVTLTIIIFISITEKNIVETYSNSHIRIVDDITNTYNNNYEQAVSLLNEIGEKKVVHNFLLSEQRLGVESMNTSFNMTKYMNSTSSNLTDLSLNMFISSQTNTYYAYGDQRIMNHDELLMLDLFNDNHNQHIQFDIIERGITLLTQHDPQVLLHKNFFDDQLNYIGKIVMSFSLNDIKNVYERFIDNNDISVNFINHEGKVILSNNTHYNAESEHSHSFLTTTRKLDIPNVYINTIINRSHLINDVYRLKTLFLTVSSLLVVLGFILYKIVRSITNPIYQLSNHFKNLSKEKIDITELGGTYEISNLANAYNEMVDNVDLYINNLLELENKKRKSDLTALLRQINPHFIYNTLTTVKFLIISQQNELAGQALEDFIIMLETTSQFDTNLITIEEEYNILNHYIRLQKLRFGPQVSVNINIPKEIMNYKIPHLLLQPLIENALFHAFDSKGGVININFSLTNENIKIEVMDNGKGIDDKQLLFIEKQMDSESPSDHIGIANVHQRIKLEFGDAYGLSIFSQFGLGTIINITIPAII